jgi:hypothetical protein
MKEYETKQKKVRTSSGREKYMQIIINVVFFFHLCAKGLIGFDFVSHHPKVPRQVAGGATGRFVQASAGFVDAGAPE